MNGEKLNENILLFIYKELVEQNAMYKTGLEYLKESLNRKDQFSQQIYNPCNLVQQELFYIDDLGQLQKVLYEKDISNLKESSINNAKLEKEETKIENSNNLMPDQNGTSKESLPDNKDQ